MQKTLLLMLALLATPFSQAAPLPFDTYIRLHQDMSEAELLQVAGKPDYIKPQAADAANAAGEGARFLYWLGADDLPYTTQVVVERGVVVDILREPKR
ncbi:hypothetical protein [uncultured Aquitalea sp.]|uniref:hypothetical protein n=1 Tax=uncultured Aquitalea sp. TaxID=540272 RepID=UPI0025E9DC82|nr:hypothetical protein [uncultured Aquitalea sp.]